MSTGADAFLVRARKAARTRLRSAALLLQFEIQQELSHPGTGRLYRVRRVKFGRPRADGKRSKLRAKASDFHRASAPGRPPAPDTNTLKRSAYTEQSGADAYDVGVATKYALALQTFLNRPFMNTALARWYQKVRGRL